MLSAGAHRLLTEALDERIECRLGERCGEKAMRAGG
jgi:hypothetical protein